MVGRNILYEGDVSRVMALNFKKLLIVIRYTGINDPDPIIQELLQNVRGFASFIRYATNDE